jgi:hypothetical protein
MSACGQLRRRGRRTVCGKCGRLIPAKTRFDGSFLIRRQVGLDLLKVIVRVGERVMHIGRPQARILLYDLLDTHSLAAADQNRGHADASPDHDRLPAAAAGSLFDVAVIVFRHEPCYSFGSTLISDVTFWNVADAFWPMSMIIFT